MNIGCWQSFGLSLVAMALSACGGGDDGGGATPPPAPSPSAGSVQLSAPTYSVSEAGPNAEIAITRTGGSAGAVSVSFSTADSSATATEDYGAVVATVTFAAGDAAAKVVSVPILDDTADEPDETVTLTLSAPSGGAVLGAPTAAVLTITDDDVTPSAPALSMSLAIKQLKFAWEAASGATFYRFLQDTDGTSVFAQVGTDLPADAMTATVDIAVHEHDWANSQYRVEACNDVGCTPSNSMNTMDRMLEAVGYLKASNAGSGDKLGSAVALSADGNTLAVGAFEEDSDSTGIGGDQASNAAPNAGAAYVFARTGDGWSQQAYIKASNAESFDRFGYAVALSGDGNTLAVGAYSESSGASAINGDQSDNSVPRSGAVYVFVRDDISWSHEAYVKSSNPDSEDFFGLALTLDGDGDTLAVGAYGEDSYTTFIDGDQSDNSASAAGAVYVFRRSGSAWEQQSYLKASNTQAGDQFGASLALSGDGDMLAVGAPAEDSNATGVDGNQSDDSAGLSGAVYVFTRDVVTWTQRSYLKASNTGAGDQFGFALALSSGGDTLAVGAAGEDSAATGIGGDGADNSAEYSGAAYVFAFVGTTWIQQAYLKASISEAGDQFSLPLALSGTGDVLVAGAVGESSTSTGVDGDESDNSAFESGAAYVFVRDAAAWRQQSYVKAPNTDVSDNFGYALSISGDGRTLAIGAPNEQSTATEINGDQTDNSASETGAVYLY